MDKGLKGWFFVGLGALVLSLAINMFLSPGGIVTGGVTGLGIIIERLTLRWLGFVVPIWATNLIVDTPLLIYVYRLRDMDLFKKTLFGSLSLTVFLWLTALINTEKSDYILSTVFGGALSGLGVGLIFRGEGTTGGSDLIATLLNRRFKDIKISNILFVIDSIVILLGFFTFGQQATMYALITVFIASKVIDLVVAGVNYAKVVFILSDCPEKINLELINKLGRGATILFGRGGYTGKDKNVVMVVASARQIGLLKELIYNIDRRAFVFIADVREVLGDF